MIIRRNLNIEGLEATIGISLNGRNFPGVRRIEMLRRFHGVGVSLVALAFASAAAAQEVRPGGGDTPLSGDGDASSAVGGGVEDIVVTAQRRMNGRATCRERGCQIVSISVAGGA